MAMIELSLTKGIMLPRISQRLSFPSSAWLAGLPYLTSSCRSLMRRCLPRLLILRVGSRRREL